MAGNDQRTVSSGDRIRIPAQTWNRLLGLLHPSVKPLRQSASVKNLYARNPYIASTLRIRNDYTGVPQFSVLGVTTTTIINPATSAATLLAWKQQPLIAGNIPALTTHLGKFVVTLEAVASGAFCLAVASGAVAVQIDMLDADHRYADVKDADATQLQSRAMGAARIMWVESGTGTKWGIVNIGVLPPALFPVIVAVDGGAAGDATTQCDYTYTVTDLAGYQIGTGKTPLKARPAKGALFAQATGGYGTGFYATDGSFVLWDANETLDVDPCT